MKDIKPIKIAYDKLKDKKTLDKTNQNSNDDKKELITNTLNEINENNDEIDEFKDISEFLNKDGFNKKNIDFKYLKKELNNIYNDERLVANVINHIRDSLDSPVEILWETEGMKNKILIKSRGAKKYVNLSSYLVSRAKSGEKTLQVLHNHTSGTPLPNPKDLTNLTDYNIINGGLVGNYGFLNMENSFKKLNKVDISNIETKTNKIYDDLKSNAFKNNLSLKYQSEELRKRVIYKYTKNDIINIVKRYDNEFKKFGIKFKYIPYKLKKR